MSRNPCAGMTTEQELHHLRVENERCKNRIRNLEIDYRKELIRQRQWERRHSREWERIATDRGQRLVKIQRDLRATLANCDQENNQ